jgi:hypothetical protein
MDQELRNKLRHVVTQCRKLLEDDTRDALEGKFGIFAKKEQVTADPKAKLTHLTDEEQAARKDILDHFAHIQARGFKPKDALDQLIREIAFTHLNRLCAYKMMEAREVYVGGQKFREAVSRGVNSNGVKFYLAEHEEDERLFNTGHQDIAYRHFLDWLGGLLSDEIGVLFNPNDPANRLYPRQKTMEEVLDLLNGGGINADEIELRGQWPNIWSQDETIGWVYQYFTPKELRDQARKESQAPRNSYELAFRNQFFTPRYVVEFLTDNTLGRIWYEMRKGDTKLKDQCRYMVRRPTEIFLKDGDELPKDIAEDRDVLSQEALLKLPVYIPHRAKKDPRELKVLDPACGSGHFLLYGFDLLLTIYEEAYADPDLGPALQKYYPTLDALKRDVPRLILAHNLHGIDIDLRCSQIAALALWLRCQRAYQDMGLKKDRPKITRSNFVCAEPMPGEVQMLKEFVAQLEPRVLGQIVEVVFDKMKLAGEAGSLLKIEEDIRDAVAAAKKQWVRETTQATDKKGHTLLFTQAEMDRLAGIPKPASLFDLSDISDDQFFEQAEVRAIEALRSYAEKAHNGQRLQRRLFAEDAVRGFAFIDLCQKRYDVVLMNPPFGEYPDGVQSLFKTSYTNGYHDIALCFVVRVIELLTPGGIAGPLTNRTGFYLSGAREWRSEVMSKATLAEFVDLGLDVLDTAMVQVAAYTLRTPPIALSCSWFARLIKVPNADKKSRLCEALEHTCHAKQDSAVFQVNCGRFKNLPGQSLGYWLTTNLLQKLGAMKTTRTQGLEVRIGLQTSDDFHYLRNWWELASDSQGWLPFAKGGEFHPYFDDISLCVDWRDNGASYWTPVNPKIGKPFSNIWMLGETISRFFGSGGLTYPRRTSKKFNPRLLPVGCAFADKGPMIRWSSRQHELAFLALAYSRVFEWVMTAQVGKEGVDTRAAAISYEAGTLLSTPLPTLLPQDIETLATLAGALVITAAKSQLIDEVSHWFVTPHLVTHGTLQEIAEWRVRVAEEALVARLELETSVEGIANRSYGLSGEDSAELDDALFPLATSYPKQIDEPVAREFKTAYMKGTSLFYRNGEESEGVSARGRFHADDLEGASHLLKTHPATLLHLRQKNLMLRASDLSDTAASIFSWSFGVCFGRWNIENKGKDALSSLTYELLLKSVPRVSPAMLKGKDGLSASSSPAGYPLPIKWDGILADDPESEHDAVRRVRDVLEVIWGDGAEGIEKEACETLGLPALRDYFRKSGVGGLFGDHIRRYSKNRRKAPIYWLLQSAKKNYALWLYYHRLDKDLLFKALVNYVEPKVRLETSRLDSLRIKKAAVGDSGKDVKRLAKEIERQEDLLSELRDFEDKLHRAANLHLVPDLNDGVVLNIAPLWELVPWKEAKKYWDELLKGEYEWSSIGKQLRRKGLVK